MKTIPPSSILIAFEDLPDPRKNRNQSYTLFDVISISILAVLCGADDWVAVNLWGKCNHSWLSERGICTCGVPSHDTLNRFFRFLDPHKFEKCFVKWTQMIAQEVKGVIAIDGKTLRNSGDATRDGKAIHIVSAFAAENGLVLGQLATEEKSNEITAIPKLLEMLDIKGTTITIDAAGCQKDIARKIREGEGEYVLALKGNQGNLYAEVENFFSQVMETTPQEADCDYFATEERSRARQEKREMWTTQMIDWLPQLNDWIDLHTLACVKSTRTVKGKTSIEMRYYISSLTENAEGHNQKVRSHWSVENKLHWQLDVTYGEDKSKVRKDHGPENLSVLRRCSLNLLKSDTKTKVGIKNKRAKAGWDREYMVGLLHGK
jgi:predicted transposase YbfD/YdcC